MKSGPMFGSNEGRSWVWTEDKRAPGGRSMGGGGGDGEDQFWVGANGPPTDILLAAYVGALDSVKAMIAVSVSFYVVITRTNK